jgi:hypothetical protein
MKILTVTLTFCFCLILSSKAERESITLTSNDGKSISVKLVSKKDVSVLVEMEGGKEFQIPYSRLSEESVSLIKNWNDPCLILFEQLNSNYNLVFTEGKGVQHETRGFMVMCKEYGYYTELGKEGLPEGGLSLASLFFGLSKYKYQEQCAQIIHERYTSVSRDSIGWSGQGLTQKFIRAEMSRIAREWPQGLPYYAIEDFRKLQRAFLKLSQQIEERRRSGSDSPYLLTEEVKKYSSRIAGLIKPYKSKLAEGGSDRDRTPHH